MMDYLKNLEDELNAPTYNYSIDYLGEMGEELIMELIKHGFNKEAELLRETMAFNGHNYGLASVLYKFVDMMMEAYYE